MKNYQEYGVDNYQRFEHSKENMTEQNNNLEDEISDSYDYIIVGLGVMV